MGSCAFNAHGPRRPGIVGAGIELAGIAFYCIGLAVHIGGNNLVGEFGDGTPIPLAGRLGFGLRRGLAAALGRRRPWRGPAAEQIGYGPGRGLHGQSWWNMGGNVAEQPGGVGNAPLRIDPDAISILAALVQDGEAGVEGGAVPRIGAPVDGGRKHHAGVEAFEGICPGGIAGDAMGRGDGGEPPAGRKHGEGRAQVAQIGVMAHAVDAGRD